MVKAPTMVQVLTGGGQVIDTEQCAATSDGAPWSRYSTAPSPTAATTADRRPDPNPVAAAASRP
jgi:glycerol dehydrogenase-like iron-containing ADH family enzyme